MTKSIGNNPLGKGTSWGNAHYEVTLDKNLFPQLRTPEAIKNALYLAAAQMRLPNAAPDDNELKTLSCLILPRTFPIVVEYSTDKMHKPCILVKLKNLPGFLKCNNITDTMNPHDVHTELLEQLNTMLSRAMPGGISPKAMIEGIKATLNGEVVLDATPHTRDT